ncbi:MAG: ion channel [Endozoicomonadaceae bacterium]|nr:ion channel [Endozoicomonadaceae bacterium]MCY4329047.1 ion channel [Endozoicomonadaceae bacterium]
MQGSKQCKYYCYRGKRCPELALNKQKHCFWHCPEADKSGSDIKEHLESLIKEGRSLCGFQLAGAKLDGICLIHPHTRTGADLTGVNLKRASLVDAHLYKVNFTNACLLKAKLDNANLNSANFEGADLLGISLKNAKFEHVRWGKHLHQEVVISQKKQEKIPANTVKQMHEEAEEICRYLRKECERNGLSYDAGKFFYKEMYFHRFTLPLFSWRRFISWFIDNLCGYGEKPVRLISFSIMFITLCALGYFFTGVDDGGIIVGYESRYTLMENFWQFAESLYFSIVTFTTLGYGDIVPIGAGRLIAAMEAFVGSFAIALYVVVFVRKMSH